MLVEQKNRLIVSLCSPISSLHVEIMHFCIHLNSLKKFRMLNYEHSVISDTEIIASGQILVLSKRHGS